jgi:DNA-binding MarR family transcriptional regulator
MERVSDEFEALIQIEEAFTALFRASHVQRVHDHFSRKAGVDLDRSSYVALCALQRQATARVSDLAVAAGVDHSTMSRLVNRLLQEGLIEGETSPADRRVLLLRLSSRGEEVVNTVLEIRREGLRAVLATWTAAERRTFAQLLTRFVGCVEETIRQPEPAGRSV